MSSLLSQTHNAATGKRGSVFASRWECYLSVQAQEEHHEEEEDSPEIGARQPGQSFGVSNERQTRTCTKRKELMD